MKTSIRIVTFATVFLFALAASQAFGGTKATRNVAVSPFIFDVSLTSGGPATLEFGVTEKGNVPYPPIGTPADASLKHIFFVGSGAPEIGQAADYSQLACSYLSGDTPQVWKLQSLADTTVYFSLKEGEDPGNLTIDDGESEPVDLHDGDSAKLVKGKSYYIRTSDYKIDPIGTIRVSMLKGATTVKVPFPQGYVIALNGWKEAEGMTKQVFAYDENGNALFTSIHEEGTPKYPGGDIQLSYQQNQETNEFTVTVTNLPENLSGKDTAYFQFGFDYTKDNETLSSLVVVDVTTPLAATLAELEYGAYDGEGAEAAVVVEDDKELHGTAVPANTAVLTVPASNDSRYAYVKMTYNVTRIADGPSDFQLTASSLPLTDKYTIMTDATPLGVTQIEYDNGATTIPATLSDGKYTFNGMNMPAEATLTVVLKVEQGAEQVNVTPWLTFDNNDWALTSLYILPIDNSGTLNFDDDVDIDMDDAMYLYNYVSAGCPLANEEGEWFTADLLLGFTDEQNLEKAEIALAYLQKDPLRLLDYDEDGEVNMDDAMYVYNYVSAGCPLANEEGEWFTADLLLGFTDGQNLEKAEIALSNLQKLASKVLAP